MLEGLIIAVKLYYIIGLMWFLYCALFSRMFDMMDDYKLTVMDKIIACAIVISAWPQDMYDQLG